MIRYSALLASMLVLPIVTVLAVPGAGQTRRSGPNEAGLLEWLPFEAVTCTRCEGAKTQPCRTCAGDKKLLPVRCGECRDKGVSRCNTCFGLGTHPDPFEIWGCTRCDARGAVPCELCGGKCRIQLQDGTEGLRCRVCNKKGFFPCSVCKGKGLHPIVLADGKRYDHATPEALEKLKNRLLSLQDASARFTDDPEERLSGRDFEDIMKRAVEILPQFAKEAKLCDKKEALVLKHTELRDIDKTARGLRKQVVFAVRNALLTHLNLLNACLDLHQQNRQLRDKKAGAGSSGGR